MATSYGLPLGESYLRDKMQEVIDREGLPDGIDAEALMKVLNNPEMAALLAGLAKGVTV